MLIGQPVLKMTRGGSSIFLLLIALFIFFCSIFDLEIVKFLHLKTMTFVKW